MAKVADAAAGRIDVEVNRLAAIFALQVEQLHHQFVGVAVVDLALQQNDPVFQQQITQGHLPLALVIAIGVDIFGWEASPAHASYSVRRLLAMNSMAAGDELEACSFGLCACEAILA